MLALQRCLVVAVASFLAWRRPRPCRLSSAWSGVWPRKGHCLLVDALAWARGERVPLYGNNGGSADAYSGFGGLVQQHGVVASLSSLLPGCVFVRQLRYDVAVVPVVVVVSVKLSGRFWWFLPRQPSRLRSAVFLGELLCLLMVRRPSNRGEGLGVLSGGEDGGARVLVVRLEQTPRVPGGVLLNLTALGVFSVSFCGVGISSCVSGVSLVCLVPVSCKLFVSTLVSAVCGFINLKLGLWP